MRERGTTKKQLGKVVSNKMEKSVVVMVERMVKDDLFKKYVRKRNTFMAHDEKNECNIGDKVEITESKPLSKNKRWNVTKVVVRSELKE